VIVSRKREPNRENREPRGGSGVVTRLGFELIDLGVQICHLSSILPFYASFTFSTSGNACSHQRRVGRNRSCLIHLYLWTARGPPPQTPKSNLQVRKSLVANPVVFSRLSSPNMLHCHRIQHFCVSIYFSMEDRYVTIQVSRRGG